MLYLLLSLQQGQAAPPKPSSYKLLACVSTRSGEHLCSGVDLHKGVVDRHNKDATGLFQVGVVDIGGNVKARAGTSKGTRNANNVAISGLELFGEADLVRSRILQESDIGQLIANLDKRTRRCVEASANGHGGPGEGRAANRGTERHDGFRCQKHLVELGRYD